MNDNDELKARSVELAERTFRLLDRATDKDTKEKLHATANELILADNRQRFYDAQRILEVGDSWTEDQRALAHEINVADRNLRGGTSLDFDDAISSVGQWAESATPSDNPQDQMRILGQNLGILTSTDNKDSRKRAINFILSYVEDVLQYSHHDEDPRNEMTDPLVIFLRDIRDSLLVHRELLYDEAELLERHETEGETIDRLGMARHDVDALYA